MCSLALDSSGNMILGYVEVNNIRAGSVIVDVAVAIPKSATDVQVAEISTTMTSDADSLLSGSDGLELMSNGAAAAAATATYAAGAVIALLAFMA